MKKEYAAINLAEILLHFFLTFQLIFLVKNSVKKKRTEKGGIALYPAFPLCFMTNKMFFQRLNIMRHDVSGSSQTLGVNVLYPKMSCFHKPFILLLEFSPQTRLLHSELAIVKTHFPV